ncbi:2-isopropylmalate synthase [Methanocalculus sp. MSAO_Arc2]|uniref:2-isopropylmalate synthase n=1 Tax=Methanocalculus sp. MSAO_Arc2 TaxID=2293855 RepID=UPI0037448C76
MAFFVESRSPKRVTVFDTTLRDGEQTPGVSFTLEQKLDIARLLSEIGVHTIEAGFPSSSEQEKETVATIAAEGLSASICGLSRSRKADVDTCLDCGVDMVHVFIPTSDIQRENTIKKSREEVIAMTGEIVAYVRDHLGSCMFSAMDATRTDTPYLINVLRTAVDAGATVVNIPDTVGVFTPKKMHDLIGLLAEEIKVPIDIHCHNDFGLAVANTTTAVEAGARQVQVTVNGIGERAGNADIAQTVMVLEAVHGIQTGIETTRLVEMSRLVSRYSGIPIVPVQPVVGDNAFAHESGIHSHGIIANTQTFEPGIMTPEMVGHRRRLALGKHVGRHAVRQMLSIVHINPTDVQLDEIVDRIKTISSKGKRVTDHDLYVIAEDVMDIQAVTKAVELLDIAVMCGNHSIPTASVRAFVNGVEKVASAIGNGPVDAAVNAVLNVMPVAVSLKEFRIEAITGGTDALGHVTITVEDPQGRTYDASSSGDDIVLASAEAMINAINLLEYTRKTP